MVSRLLTLAIVWVCVCAMHVHQLKLRNKNLNGFFSVITFTAAAAFVTTTNITTAALNARDNFLEQVYRSELNCIDFSYKTSIWHLANKQVIESSVFKVLNAPISVHTWFL